MTLRDLTILWLAFWFSLIGLAVAYFAYELRALHRDEQRPPLARSEPDPASWELDEMCFEEHAEIPGLYLALTPPVDLAAERARRRSPDAA